MKTPTKPAQKPAAKMDELLKELERAAKAAEVRVSYEPLGGELGAGGVCKVKGEWRVIIDKRATPAERVLVLAQALGRFPVTDLLQQREEPPLPEEAAELLARYRRA